MYTFRVTEDCNFLFFYTAGPFSGVKHNRLLDSKIPGVALKIEFNHTQF